MFDWFHTGAHRISGVAETTIDRKVSIQLAASGGPGNCAAVTASTDAATGIDATQLSAERAAFKFLFRMRYPEITTDEIDGLSALRQGVIQFAQYAGTVPGVGDNAAKRTSSLSKAAFNMNFFRTSIPLHSGRIGAQTLPKETSLNIGDEIRQAVLLAEGVAHALIGSEHDRLARLTAGQDKVSRAAAQSAHDHIHDADAGGKTKAAPAAEHHAEHDADTGEACKANKDVNHTRVNTHEDRVDHVALAAQEHTAAIDCFRQLQDWPGPKTKSPSFSAQTQKSPQPALSELLRQQAAYNEAVIWRHMGHVGRSVLMLTDLLGEKAPDTVRAETTEVAQTHRKADLPSSIRLPALLARHSAFAEYSRDDWTLLPAVRANLLIDDGEQLVKDLNDHRGEAQTHDERLAQYMYVEALRALGHVELMRVVTGPAKDLYRDGRPTSLPETKFYDEGRAMVKRAIESMLKCAQMAPSCALYSDLAEAYLLYGDLEAAEGYARHATLR